MLKGTSMLITGITRAGVLRSSSTLNRSISSVVSSNLRTSELLTDVNLATTCHQSIRGIRKLPRARKPPPVEPDYTAAMPENRMRPSLVVQSAEEDGKWSNFLHPDERIISENQLRTEEVMDLVDNQISSKSYGRLFAVIYANGFQKKVTSGDLVLYKYDLGCDIGAQIVLDKIILVGGRDFTIIGRPILPSDLVEVHATVVDKNLSRTYVWFPKRKKPTRTKSSFQRHRETVLRINNIELVKTLRDAKDRAGHEARNEDPTIL